MTLFDLIVLALASWRISSLFVYEAGPFRIFFKIRKLAGIQHEADGYPAMIPDGFFSELLSCIWCLSVWVSGFLLVFWLIFPSATVIFSSWFALSALSILCDRLTRN